MRRQRSRARDARGLGLTTTTVADELMMTNTVLDVLLMTTMTEVLGVLLMTTMTAVRGGARGVPELGWMTTTASSKLLLMTAMTTAVGDLAVL